MKVIASKFAEWFGWGWLAIWLAGSFDLIDVYVHIGVHHG